MTPGDNAAAMRVHATHSTAREVTARALAQRWQHLQRLRSPRPRICDLGTGDGEFLDLVLAQIGITGAIEIVEPDEDLAPFAVQRLRAHNHEVTRVPDASTGPPIDAYLAAHVLVYLPDIDEWFASARARLSPTGILSVVQRAPECDGNALRKLVRRHHGIPAKVSSAQIQRLADTAGMAADIVPIASTFSYPVTDPQLAPVPAESADPDLARLICWLAGLPSNQRLPEPLRQAISAFLRDHMVRGAFVLDQADLLITVRRPAPRPATGPQDAGGLA